MAVKYVPYFKDPIEGQAILDNFTRTNRVLKYAENDKVYENIKRGLPLYEMIETEVVGDNSKNLVIRGECLSACAYLKENNITVDLVYIDPPFASGADYAKTIYIRRNPKIAEAIKQAEETLDIDELKAFEEKMYGDVWNKETYLNWMYENLIAIKAIMSDSASIYVHLDHHIGHYVKILLDEIFGEENFQREIIWDIQVLSGFKTIAPNWVRGHDVIFYYSKDSENRVFNKLIQPHTEKYINMFNRVDKDGRKFMVAHGRTRYLDELSEGKPFGDVWSDVMSFQQQPTSAEKVDYTTQKPETLLKRIIEASSNEKMIIADFFGGSGVTAKVANDLNRNFIHCDVGINSVQTTRDRLISAGASFRMLDIKDGVNLYRNPVQTMDKIKSLIPGLKNEDKVGEFWEGSINDTKYGLMPVYVPNLMDSSTKLLDIPLMNKIINLAIPELPEEVKKVIIYYIDIIDEKEIRQFIKEYLKNEIEIELRDLKNILDETVLNDIIDYTIDNEEIIINSFNSDRLVKKINEYNEKMNSQMLSSGNKVKLIEVSNEGLELIEWISLDCTSIKGSWNSDVEIKIDKNGYVIENGKKTNDFWNGKIKFNKKPLRMKIRNISGDESIIDIKN